VIPIAAHPLAALAADLGHVLAVLADDLAPLPAGLPRLVPRELMGSALLVGGLAALAGDLPLLVLVHRREAPMFGAAPGRPVALALVALLAARRLARRSRGPRLRILRRKGLHPLSPLALTIIHAHHRYLP